jgi:uncharacterized protein YijF (DUF1287 family)
MRGQKLDQEIEEKIIEKWMEGYPKHFVAKESGVCTKTVTKILRKFNIEID